MAFEKPIPEIASVCVRVSKFHAIANLDVSSAKRIIATAEPGEVPLVNVTYVMYKKDGRAIVRSHNVWEPWTQVPELIPSDLLPEYESLGVS